MAAGLACDLTQLKNVRIVVARHRDYPTSPTATMQSIIDSPPRSSSIRWIDAEESCEHAWQSIASSCDIAVVIAPELNRILPRVLQLLRSEGINLWNADDMFTRSASDKALTARAWRIANVRQPWTALAHKIDRSLFESPLSNSQSLIFKRRDGAGGLGTTLLTRDSKQLESHNEVFDRPSFDLLNWLKCYSSLARDNAIVQPWIEGRHASISAIFDVESLTQDSDSDKSTKSSSMFWTAARDQKLNFEPIANCARCFRLEYSGSGEAWQAEHQKVAEKFACKAIEAIPGKPRGWIGVDFVCCGDPSDINSYFAIEINPRLSSSYLSQGNNGFVTSRLLSNSLISTH